MRKYPVGDITYKGIDKTLVANKYPSERHVGAEVVALVMFDGEIELWALDNRGDLTVEGGPIENLKRHYQDQYDRLPEHISIYHREVSSFSA